MLSPHSQTPPFTTPSPSPPPMSVCPPWILIPLPSLTFPCSSGCPLNARLLKSPTVHMMAFHLRPKTLMPGASPVKLVATLFHTRTNVPVHLPSNIGMLTSSDGSLYFSSLSYAPRSSLFLTLQPCCFLCLSCPRAFQTTGTALWRAHRAQSRFQLQHRPWATFQASTGQTFRGGAHPVPSFRPLRCSV